MSVERINRSFEMYRILLEKSFGDYTYKFVCDLSPYTHWCTAYQMSNFSLTFFKKHINHVFGVTTIKVSETPDWLIKAAQKAMYAELHEVAHETLGKKFLNASVHLSEYTGSYSHIYAVNDKVASANLIFRPIMSDDLCTQYQDTAGEGELGFCHVGIRVANLKLVADSITYEVPQEVEKQKKKEDKGTGITLQQVREYLDNV